MECGKARPDKLSWKQPSAEKPDGSKEADEVVELCVVLEEVVVVKVVGEDINVV